MTPTVFQLPVGSPDEWEPYEGMLISVDQPLTVTGTSGLGPADEIDLAVGGRLANPTSVVEPGPPAQALQDLNDRGRIPTRYVWRAAGLSASNTLRVGDLFAGTLVGVLDQRPRGYRMPKVCSPQCWSCRGFERPRPAWVNHVLSSM